MPLVKRAVEPVFISRATLDKQVKNELEGVVVNSLAGVIKQLSSISKHAENLFGELFSEANAIFQRTAGLNGRVQRLQERVVQLDSTAKEEVRVEEFSVQNHFKSTRKEEQQNLSRETLPTALYEVYHSCVRPPALHLFTPYRDDGREGMKFFTDPNYFYDLWVKEQNRLLEKRKKKEKRKHRKKKDQNLKKVVKAAQKKQYASVDKEFITPEQRHISRDVQPVSDASFSAKPSPGPPSHEPPDYHMPPPPSAQMNIPNAPPPPPPPPGGPPSGAPPPPPLPPGQAAFQLPIGAPPPPPPPMASYDASRAAPTPPTMHHFPKAPAPPPPPLSNAPPAPPPPTIPAAPAGGPPAPPLPGFPGHNPLSAPPPAVAQEPPKPKPQQDERSALLRAIEMGMQLRRVERSDAEKQQQGQGGDVASILKRRIAVEMSDTESDSYDDSDEDDWSD